MDAQSPTRPKVDLGSAIPTVLNRQKVAALLFYETEFREIVREVSQGKGGERSSEEISYEIDFAGAFNFGEQADIETMYFNGEVVYSDNPLNQDTAQTSQDFFNNHLELFDGAIGQPFSSTISSRVSPIPRWNGMTYFTCRELDVNRYGNNIPTVTAVIRSKQTYNLFSGLERIFQICRVNEDSNATFGAPIVQADSSLSNISFEGIVIPNDGTDWLSLIEPIVEFYQLSINENQGRYVIQRPLAFGATSTDLVTIDGDKLFHRDSETTYKVKILGNQDVANSVSVVFQDPNKNFDQNSITAINTQTLAVNEQQITMPMALTRNAAIDGSERILRNAWTRRESLKFTLPITEIDNVGVGSIVTVSNEPAISGKNWLVKSRTIGAKYLLEYEADAFNPMPYLYSRAVSSGTSITGGATGTSEAQNALLGYVFDVNLIDQADSPTRGIYVLANTGATNVTYLVYESEDNVNFNLVGAFNNFGATATATTVLPSADFHVPDEINVINVLANDDDVIFNSVSTEDWLDFAQIIAVGRELISFRTATFLGGNMWQLSGLLRGIKGTESFVGTHVANEPVGLLKGDNTTPGRIALSVPVGATRYYKFTVQASADLNTLPTQTVLHSRASEKAYAPMIYGKEINTVSNNLTYRLVQRDPAVGLYEDNVPLPSPTYGTNFELAITGGTDQIGNFPLRAINYTAAQQITDFGSPIDESYPYTVELFESNSLVGRGYSLGTLVNP